MQEQIITLTDQRTGLPLKIKLKIGAHWLEIQPEGYGEFDALPGDGSPVCVEIYDGRLRALVTTDINEEAQIIDLEGARESNLR